MSAHETLEIRILISSGSTKMLLDEFKRLRDLGKNDAARYLLQTAHQTNKADKH